jgi:hypothetical protein
MSSRGSSQQEDEGSRGCFRPCPLTFFFFAFSVAHSVDEVLSTLFFFGDATRACCGIGSIGVHPRQWPSPCTTSLNTSRSVSSPPFYSFHSIFHLSLPVMNNLSYYQAQQSKGLAPVPTNFCNTDSSFLTLVIAFFCEKNVLTSYLQNRYRSSPATFSRCSAWMR